MSNAYLTARPGSGDYASAVRLYMDNLESWKQGYEQLLRNTGLMPETSAATPQNMLGEWQNGGQALFKRFVRQQIELCRFFERRWESYLNLPEQAARCRTPVDLGQLQFNFVSRMSTDYMQESAKLAQQTQELMTSLMSGSMVPR